MLAASRSGATRSARSPAAARAALLLLLLAGDAAALAARFPGLPPRPPLCRQCRAAPPRLVGDRSVDVPLDTAEAAVAAGTAAPAAAAAADEPACRIGGAQGDCVGQTSAGAMTINLSKNIVGSGVLSLSAGIAACSGSAGAMAPAALLLLLIGGVSAYSFSLLARVGEENGTGSYRETWAKLFGERSARLVDATIVIECMCAAVSFAIIIGDTFSAVAALCGAPPPLLRPNAWIVALSALVLLPLCLLRDLGSLAFGSVLGTGGTLFTAGFMLFRALDGSYAPGGRFFGALGEAGRPHFGGGSSAGPLSACILVSLVANAFLAHYNAPTMYRQLAPPPRAGASAKLALFNRVVAGGFGLACLVSAAMMTAGFATFGAASSGLILNNYAVGDSLATLARLGVGLSIIFSYPLNFVGLREGLLSLLGWQARAARRTVHAGATVMLLGAMNGTQTPLPPSTCALRESERHPTRPLAPESIGLALVVKDLGALAAFSGAIVGSALIYVFPAAMFLQSARRRRAREFVVEAGTGAGALPRIKRREVAANWMLGGLGVVLAVVGGAVAAKGW